METNTASPTKFKLTLLERNWMLYDVGNSAFTLLITTIIPIYFNYLGESAGLTDAEYLAYWGYAASIVTIIVAILGPVCGAIADTKDFKKRFFIASMMIGVVACLALGLASTWISFLIIFIIAKTGYSTSLVFYDAMLTDVTTDERFDRISSYGYAWGYIGSCVPFVLCLVFVLMSDSIGISMTTAMAISFAITSAWWVLMTVPLFRSYKQIYYVERKPHAIKNSFKRIGETLAHVKEEKKVFIFLLSFFFYIYRRRVHDHRYGDGVRLRTGSRLDRTAAGAARHPDSGVPFSDFLRKDCKKGQHRKADKYMHHSIPLHCGLCHIPQNADAILDTGRMRRPIPGRNPGYVEIVLRQDNTA